MHWHSGGKVDLGRGGRDSGSLTRPQESGNDNCFKQMRFFSLCPANFSHRPEYRSSTYLPAVLVLEYYLYLHSVVPHHTRVLMLGGCTSTTSSRLRWPRKQPV